MAGRRIVYLLTLAGCILFFSAYQLWFSFFALVTILLLPVFSLVVSLPAMVTARLELRLPKVISVGQPQELTVFYGSNLPTPPWKCTIVLESPLTGKQMKTREAEDLPTDHCGGYRCEITRAKVYDYLGLFALPMKHSGQRTVVVRPRSLPLEVPSLDQLTTKAWRPKPGGGFAENHELRLYRPGDSIQQIHWKLSAKTGKLILREPMEPLHSLFLVRLDLQGDPGQMDRKLGNLLWLGLYLLERNLSFRIQALTGDGIVTIPVCDDEALFRGMDQLLLSKPVTEGTLRDRPEKADWQYFIGGGANET